MAAEHEAAHESSSTVLELPSFFNLLGKDALHHDFLLGLSLHLWVPILMSVLVGGILVALTHFATRDMKKVPTGLQAFMEMAVVGIEKFFGEILGPKLSLIFLPFIGSLFLYILFMNLIGLIPMFHSPTSSPNTTVALAIIVFFITHYVGVTRNGLFGYIKHFVGEPVWMAPLMFPIHIVGELARPLSLSMRLFGNIMGEDTAIAILVGFGVGALFIPIQFPMLALAMMTSVIQAAVFAILASVYISGAAIEHDDH